MDAQSRVTRRLPALSVLALAAAIAGCGGGDVVVARVGDQKITVSDYQAALEGAMFRYAGTRDSARASLIEDLVRQKLLLDYGYRSGILVDSMVQRDRRHMEDQMLRSALVGQLVPSTVPVSDAEVRRFWSWRDSASRVQLIYTAAHEMALAARAELERGADFGSVANRYNMAGTLPPEGEIGYVLPGALADPLDRMVRVATPGRIVGPVRAPGEGWFLLRVVDRQPSARDSFDVAAPQLEQALRQRKRRMMSAQAFEQLREQYHVRLVPGGAQAMFGFFNTPGAMGMPDPDPTPEKLGQVLARYDGDGQAATYTLAAALDDLQSSEGEPPNPYMMSSFGPWIEARVVDRVVMIEARRRLLNQEPAFLRQLDSRFESELLNSVFEVAIAQTTVPTDDDRRAAYERERGPEDPPFESLDEARRQTLGYPAVEFARMRRYTTLSDSLRASTPVTVYEGVVRRLRPPANGG